MVSYLASRRLSLVLDNGFWKICCCCFTGKRSPLLRQNLKIDWQNDFKARGYFDIHSDNARLYETRAIIYCKRFHNKKAFLKKKILKSKSIPYNSKKNLHSHLMTIWLVTGYKKWTNANILRHFWVNEPLEWKIINFEIPSCSIVKARALFCA